MYWPLCPGPAKTGPKPLKPGTVALTIRAKPFAVQPGAACCWKSNLPVGAKGGGAGAMLGGKGGGNDGTTGGGNGAGGGIEVPPPPFPATCSSRCQIIFPSSP
eukprot:7385159-Prymnesium_polylepis.1